MEFSDELKEYLHKYIDEEPRAREFTEKAINEYEKAYDYIESKSFYAKPENSRLPVQVINVDDAMQVFSMGLKAFANIMGVET